MRIYLDNCCFNRPYDDQTQLKIYLESQAKLDIQSKILHGEYELIWSFILEYENEQNPFSMRQDTIGDWRNIAKHSVAINQEIREFANSLLCKGIKIKDALHISCAVEAGCKVFLTTDRKLLKTEIPEILIMNPINFISDWRGDHGSK